MKSASDWAQEMADLQKIKPSSIARMFGTNGPTPKQLADYKEKMNLWNAAYRKAAKEQKKQLVIDNENYRKKQEINLPMVKLSVNPVKKTRKNPVEQDIGKSKYPHYTFDYSIQFDAGAGGWATVAGTNNLSYAKDIAHMFAAKFKERTIRVSSEK